MNREPTFAAVFLSLSVAGLTPWRWQLLRHSHRRVHVDRQVFPHCESSSLKRGYSFRCHGDVVLLCARWQSQAQVHSGKFRQGEDLRASRWQQHHCRRRSFPLPRILFQPSFIVSQGIMKFGVGLCQDFSAIVVFAGGTTMFQSTGKCMTTDLTSLLPSTSQIKVVASQSSLSSPSTCGSRRESTMNPAPPSCTGMLPYSAFVLPSRLLDPCWHFPGLVAIVVLTVGETMFQEFGEVSTGKLIAFALSTAKFKVMALQSKSFGLIEESTLSSLSVFSCRC